MAVRRSFRMGLWLGLLAGVLVAILKVIQTRREGAQPEVAEWPPDRPSQPAPAAPPEPTQAATAMATAEPTLAAVRQEPPVEKTQAPAASPSAPTRKAGKATAKKAAKKAVKKASKATAKKAARKAARKAWVEPDDGVCPPSHPVKAKLSSGLFHLPGMVFYNRTRADRCYADEDSAVRDGLSKSKR